MSQQLKGDGMDAQRVTILGIGELLALLIGPEGRVVPPAGVEPALPGEPHFECGASTSSAKGASQDDYHPEDRTARETVEGFAQTLPRYTQYGLGTMNRLVGAGVYGEQTCFVDRLADIQAHLQLPNWWKAYFRFDTRGFWYHQVVDECATDNVTGEQIRWAGRKWLISEHMTDGEIVQTVFKACMTAAEHELRESFKYRGQAIFDPHYDIEKLVELRAGPGALKVRDHA